MTSSPDTTRTAYSDLAERLRSWGENDPDEIYFEGDALACLLIDCGKASEALAQLQADLIAARDDRDSFRMRLQEAEMAVEASGWRPISSTPKDDRRIVLLIAPYPGQSGVWSDPRAGWWDGRAWTRWPHDFPPTLWAPIPEFPAPLPDTHPQTAGGKGAA